jgi:DNA repair exonuclease SbcCD ATPase subunit
MKGYKKQIDQIKPAYRRLQRLNDIANAKSSSEGGKYNFESYSLANAFKEILQAANVRLNHMSGGKYELVHETKTSRSNALAGFDIKVLDAFTNEMREAASLSGGETFEVSMSLALGLSDVVQSQTGNIRLESLSGCK